MYMIAWSGFLLTEVALSRLFQMREINQFPVDFVQCESEFSRQMTPRH